MRVARVEVRRIERWGMGKKSYMVTRHISVMGPLCIGRLEEVRER